MRSLVLIAISLIGQLCAIIPVQGQCSFTVDAGPDLKVCKAGDMITINGKVSGNGFTEIFWDPPTGLSNPKSPVTKATVNAPIEYILTARGLSNTNLIVNGNFEAGRTGFSTDYIVGSVPCYGLGYLDCEGTYDVINNPQLGHANWAACGDHTSGGGLMMVINGAAAFQNVWCQTVPVIPDMDYVFTAWITSVHSASPAVLQFSINGSNIGPNFTSSGVTCLWEKYEVIWNSGSNTSADICILNENTATGGNDFAIDDLGFRKVCEVKDTMKIEIEEIIVEIEDPEIVTCDQPTQKLNAKASSNGPGWTYQWTTSDGKIVSGANTAEPVIRGPGTYYLTVCSPIPNCCLTKSVTVYGRITPPDLVLTVKDTLGCKNLTVSIHSRSNIFPLDYQWSGPGGYSASDPSIVVSEAGRYTLTVIDEYNCKTIDSIDVIEYTDNPKIDINSNHINCKQDTAHLKGNSSIPGSSFEWTGPNNRIQKTDTFNVVDSGMYVLKVTTPSGCIKYDSIRIKMDLDIPVLNFIADTINCLRDSSIIKVNSSLKISRSNWQSQNNFRLIDSITIITATAGKYQFEVESENGCGDSLEIDVQADTARPQLNPVNDTLNCNKTFTHLVANSIGFVNTMDWFDDNGWIASGDSIRISKGGNFTVIAVARNGCSDTASTFIKIDTIHPFLNSFDDTLNCIVTSLNLRLTDAQTSSYNWTGPNGFSSSLKNPPVDQPGTYTVIASLPNGCSTTADVQILQDITKPIIFANDDTLTCKTDSIALSATRDQALATTEWKGPSGFTSTLLNPFVSVPGSYQLIVTNPNGCKDTASLTIYQDIRKPDLTAAGDTLNCLIRSVDLFAFSSRDSLSFFWTGPNGFTSGNKNISVNQAGTYTIRVSTPENCFNQLNVEVIEDTLRPNLQLFPDTLNCLVTQLMLDFYSNDSIISQHWSGPANFNSSQADPLITQGGNYSLTVTGANHCTEQKTIDILQDTLKPIVSATGDSINCLRRQVDLEARVIPAHLTGEWTFPNQQKVKANAIKTNAGGDYIFDVTGDNYCIQSIFLNIHLDTLVPDIAVSNDTIDCRNRFASLAVGSSTPWLNYEWSGPFSYSSNKDTNSVDKPGNYQIKITALNGCTNIAIATIGIDTATPGLDVTKDSIYCNHPEATLTASSNIVNPLFSWIFTIPQLPQFGPQIKLTTGADLFVEVQNTVNGCKTRIPVHVPQDSLIITDVVIDPVNPVCGNDFGSAQIVNVIGGHNNLKYSIDRKQSFTSNPVFNQLPAGLYTLYVIDDKNCEFQKDFQIVKLPIIETDLIPEIRLILGDSSRLDLDILPDPRLIQSIEWKPATFLSCTDCEDPIVTPLKNTTYEVTVIDTNGCKSMQRVRVIVESPKVWVPNVFTPNGDNINDLVWIHGSKAEVTKINRFQIFDRWGNRVFENFNFQPNDPEKGWDGRYNQQKCNPGVFVYWAEVELIDGKNWIIKGDISLIR